MKEKARIKEELMMRVDAFGGLPMGSDDAKNESQTINNMVDAYNKLSFDWTKLIGPGFGLIVGVAYMVYDTTHLGDKFVKFINFVDKTRRM